MMTSMAQTGYAAFISYRHVESDRAWAKWLHSALEAYRTPRALVKAGLRSRIGRVFRDEEELAASPRLSESIQAALRDSSCLIVVCSPHTPESHWVEQEVHQFIDLGRSDRILTLLIDGEPQSAFPAPLRSVEPLAADVRPRVADRPRQIRETAKLRLIAAILGCSFDDLRQREQERQKRSLVIWAAVSTLLLLIVSSLGVFAWNQRNRAFREARIARAQMLAAEAQLTLATTPSAEELGTNTPERAVLLALEALRLAPVLEADTTLRSGLARLSKSPTPDWIPVPKEGYADDPPPVPAEVISSDRRYRAHTPQIPEDPVVVDDLRNNRTSRLPHEWLLQAIQFSPNSRWLCTVTARVSIDASEPAATVLYGSTVRVFELASGQIRSQVSLADKAGIVRALFSPDGNSLATIGIDNKVRMWTPWPDQLEANACSHLTRNLSPTEWRRYLGNEPQRETCPGLPVISE